MADSLANDNTTCVVCFKNVLYFSIGECDHPVCFECSTRMRVLCLQNECPICRQDLSRVVFTDSIQPYKDLRNKVFSDRLFERQFKIGFCSEKIKNAYEKLLENCCKICDKIPPFRTFTMLSDHMRKVHERYYCDLCVKHLKIFTSERKCYTRQELGHHRRKGDLDDTSHRGHPLCEFCEERFMDADELYRHLRKEHLYCHLCDADGRNLYYATHSALAHHFRTDHYLCEEGECNGQHLTAVFRSEIDLKAHKATVHGRGMPRGAARQARTLELQFNITPHPVAQRAPRDRERAVEPPPAPSPPATPHIDTRSDEQFPRLSAAPPAPAPLLAAPSRAYKATPHIDTRSDEQFPRLSAAPPAPAPLLAAPSRAYKGADSLTRNDKNFPTLGGAAPARAPPRPAAPVAATVVRNSKPSVSIQLHSQPASASNFRLTQTSGNRISIPKKPPLSDDDFPSLGVARDDHPSIGAGTIQPPKVTLINSDEMHSIKSSQSNHQPKKAQLSSDAFPALSSTSVPATPPQWITVSKSKEKGKPKAEPAPLPRQPTLNSSSDFPTLPANSKPKAKKSQLAVETKPHPAPQSQQVTHVPNDTKTTKKDKRKNNNPKKDLFEDFSEANGFVDKRGKEYFSISVNNNNGSTETDRKIKTITETAALDAKNRNAGTGDFKLAAKEYPPLSGKAAASGAPPQPAYSARGAADGSAPPGFKARPACNGMTFTNSAGQTFPAPAHAYIPPPDFEARNRELVRTFAVALGGAEAVEEFKAASRAFRDGAIAADELYARCSRALGSKLDAVFPELVALLPDIRKQQELVVGREAAARLAVCATCGQLLAPRDRLPHDAEHWPPLSAR